MVKELRMRECLHRKQGFCVGELHKRSKKALINNRVSREEIDKIYENLPGEKELVILEHSEHEVYLNDDQERWNQEVNDFLQ